MYRSYLLPFGKKGKRKIYKVLPYPLFYLCRYVIDVIRLEKKDILRHTLDLKEVNVAFEEYNEKHDHIITRILSEIEKLPPRSQEIMLAVFVDGLKYREVAEKYHISLSTVKTLLGNAVRKLKKELGAEGLSIFLFFFRIKK